MEGEIVEYLKEKHSPQVIILAGSRAAGSGTKDSDWDIFLFCEGEKAGGFYDWNGELLDVSVRDWQKSKDAALTIPYGPLWPVKVLFDNTNGQLDSVLEKTKQTYELGPLKAYPTGCADRLSKLERWRGKIEKYKDEREVQFYYAGYIYEFLVRVWFEQQNLWPLPPGQAFSYIKSKDSEFSKLLSKFAEEKGQELAETTDKIIKKLYLLGK